MNIRSFHHSLLALLAMLCFLTSCEADFLSKEDERALFDAPSTAELDSVVLAWEKRDLIPTEYHILEQADLFSGAFVFKMVSFKANEIRQYGALIIPAGTKPLPVQIYVGGFGLDLTSNSVNVVLDTEGTEAPSILAIPALRGQFLKITINGVLYTSPLSEGEHCDAFDGATDDVLAFLNMIQQTESNADVNRTGVRGGSRGGTVAMLTGIRDPRVKRVIGVVSPTDMLELTSQHQNDPTYQCQFLSDFKNGQVPLAQTRTKMIASSPFYFAQRLPLMQLHLGLKDINVPVQQGYDLREKMDELGNTSGFQLFTYDKSHLDLATDNPELEERIQHFFSLL